MGPIEPSYLRNGVLVSANERTPQKPPSSPMIATFSLHRPEGRGELAKIRRRNIFFKLRKCPA
jgi:hypothetical protein